MKENAYTEFKSSFNDTVIETLVAFANTNGGKVLVGVDNEGMPLKNYMIGDETVQQWINQIKNKHNMKKQLLLGSALLAALIIV